MKRKQLLLAVALLSMVATSATMIGCKKENTTENGGSSGGGSESGGNGRLVTWEPPHPKVTAIISLGAKPNPNRFTLGKTINGRLPHTMPQTTNGI